MKQNAKYREVIQDPKLVSFLLVFGKANNIDYYYY